jgi:hypothetical protein
MRLFEMLDMFAGPTDSGDGARQDMKNVQSGYFMGGGAQAAMSAGLASSRPNVFGGQDYYHNGTYVGHSQPNVFGGHDYRGGNGLLQGSSMPNIFGGFDYHG